MPSTYSSNLRLELIGTGEQAGTWGTTTNTNLGTLIEQAIAGYTTVTITDANYTLTTVNGASDEARSMGLNIVSSVTLTATRNVICPNVSKLYVVRNGTTGGQSIVVTTSAGTGITVPNGATAIVLCNGTNVIDPFSTKVNKAGDTMTGQLTINATNNTPFSIADARYDVRNTSTTTDTYAGLTMGHGASNVSALLFTRWLGSNASRFSIATNTGVSPTSTISRFTINEDGSFDFYNNAGTRTANLDASGNLSVKGNVTAYAAI